MKIIRSEQVCLKNRKCIIKLYRSNYTNRLNPNSNLETVMYINGVLQNKLEFIVWIRRPSWNLTSPYRQLSWASKIYVRAFERKLQLNKSLNLMLSAVFVSAKPFGNLIYWSLRLGFIIEGYANVKFDDF
jgi:hypothetical protein